MSRDKAPHSVRGDAPPGAAAHRHLGIFYYQRAEGGTQSATAAERYLRLVAAFAKHHRDDIAARRLTAEEFYVLREFYL